MGRTKIKQYTSRLLALLLAMTLVFACAPAARAAEGSCGDNLSWSFDGSTLTISGSGAMTDFGDGNLPPWYGVRDQIRKIALPGGLTHIGNAAFYDCDAVTAVSIPGSVTSIGELAFSNCSGMTMLTLNEGLQVISDNAFEKCASLLDLRLPGTVTSIGNHAFYFCTSLSYVSIPSSVVYFGSGIFSYCHALAQADIHVPASSLPSWTFYGCEKLTVVNTQEGSVSASALKIPNTPGSTQPESPTEPEITTQITSANTTTTTQTTTTPSGGTTTSSTVVKTSEDSTTVSTTTTTQNGESTEVQKDITATVVTPEGWGDVIQQVENTQTGQKTSGSSDGITVTVYSSEGDTVSKDVLQELAGKNVSLTVQTQSGSQFILDCTKLPEKVKKDLELTYTLTPAEKVPENMEGCTVYQLSFHKSAEILTEIVMRLPGDHSFQTASLYQLEKDGEPYQLQSVMVDDSGNAHWYLRSVDHKTDYLIGINIPNAIEDSPIIPAELAGVYKVANVYDGVEYVVTGRTSSWNMGLGQVMGILAVVMVSAIVIIGFVMYTLNKRRLKNGYVPQWLDEDEE